MSWEDGPFLDSAFVGTDLAVAVSFQRLGGLATMKKPSTRQEPVCNSRRSGHAVVQWNQTVRFRVIPSIRDMSDDERHDLWWSALELVGFANNEIQRRHLRCAPVSLYASLPYAHMLCYVATDTLPFFFFEIIVENIFKQHLAASPSKNSRRRPRSQPAHPRFQLLDA